MSRPSLTRLRTRIAASSATDPFGPPCAPRSFPGDEEAGLRFHAHHDDAGWRRKTVTSSHDDVRQSRGTSLSPLRRTKRAEDLAQTAGPVPDMRVGPRARRAERLLARRLCDQPRCRRGVQWRGRAAVPVGVLAKNSSSHHCRRGPGPHNADRLLPLFAHALACLGPELSAYRGRRRRLGELDALIGTSDVAGRAARGTQTRQGHPTRAIHRCQVLCPDAQYTMRSGYHESTRGPACSHAEVGGRAFA